MESLPQNPSRASADAAERLGSVFERRLAASAGRPVSAEELAEARIRLKVFTETLRTIAARLERKNP